MKIDGSVGGPVNSDAVVSLSDIAAQIDAAEATGYDGVWTAETGHDPFLPLMIAAERSSKLTLGTSIAVAFARSPMTVAATANDLQGVQRRAFHPRPGHADQGAYRASLQHAVVGAGETDA